MKIYCEIISNIENLFDADMQNVWFQQDGARPHYAIRIREFLSRSFPDRWIGRGGTIECPNRLICLILTIFFGDIQK